MSDLVPGWKAAQAALRAEGRRLQEEGNLTMWAALVSAADILDHLAAGDAPDDLQGFIDIDELANLWVLTCSQCGIVGTYPMVPIPGRQSEPEKAWDVHVAEKHPDESCSCPRCQS